ncbi:sensor histidine kinase [Fibrivirga algicola]|uniref:histidine kinase n=1 Tax=Fibrivirga algicola TaxID=2950420 RepID=A0ABX0QHB7_9BACT|nr:ATP-binding protein [Fibrivirga algicola]ARK09475.1 histidine kinase [Fibrella sp. ES10-3-2-2]NID10352.1 histidine kinase [Fibrivirga algicola]
MNVPVLVVTIFFLLQTRNFLTTKEKMPAWDRGLIGAAIVLAGLFVIDQILDANGTYELKATWVCYVALAFDIYVVNVGARRYPPARALLLSLIPFLLVLASTSFIRSFMEKTLYVPYSEVFETSVGFAYIWVFSLFGYAARQRKSYSKEHQARIDREEAERRERQVLEGLVQERTQELTQQKAEITRQKEELEMALTELRAAQAQLVQREKLASLGELTAGIAHEIQNPLNFVNNFSDVSVDLVNELLEERQRPLAERDAGLEEELLTDLSQNLTKISHHGQRASGIVRNMLQHSRASTGQREPTDLNALADEYLRLSYHGLRAKDKSFNASFRTELDPNLPNVSLVAQDIGRVLLNLFNNAFYAVQQRQVTERQSGTLKGFAYQPTVVVTTMQTPVGVEIQVRDNGTGMSDEVQQKIFQPFFTTKPSGSGTGLGLSLSYDIITKGHGGSLLLDSKDGVGTTFTILLPAT